jgi:hypothetical protein
MKNKLKEQQEMGGIKGRAFTDERTIYMLVRDISTFAEPDWRDL